MKGLKKQKKYLVELDWTAMNGKTRHVKLICPRRNMNDFNTFLNAVYLNCRNVKVEFVK